MAILFVIAAASAFKLREDGIFACPATGYGGDYYLGYCDATAYGDYDHGAFWFELEPDAGAFAASADVLFLGSSRLQYGFSSIALKRWFAALDRSYYLLGFTHTENITFHAPLLETLRPQARAYVLNVDEFFVEHETPPGRDVMRGADTRARYVQKRAWQAPHRAVCAWLPALCGDASSFYRQRESGEWRAAGMRGKVSSGVGPVLPVDAERVAHERFNAERFIRDLGVDRDCVFLTYVPTRENERASAAAIASAIGFELISPEVENLRTFDGSHLDRESAERFAGAFLEIVGPRLRKCLNSNLQAEPGAIPNRGERGIAGTEP